jgi:hypothetical protein
MQAEPLTGRVADQVTIDASLVPDAQYAVTSSGYVLLSVPIDEVETGVGFQHDCVIEDRGHPWGPFRGTERQLAGPHGADQPGVHPLQLPAHAPATYPRGPADRDSRASRLTRQVRYVR